MSGINGIISSQKYFEPFRYNPQDLHELIPHFDSVHGRQFSAIDTQCIYIH